MGQRFQASNAKSSGTDPECPASAGTLLGHSSQMVEIFETRDEAEQWARAIEIEMDKGAFVSRAEAESPPLMELRRPTA